MEALKKGTSSEEPSPYSIRMPNRSFEIIVEQFPGSEISGVGNSRETSRPRLASKVTPPPQSGLGAYKGTLWDPLAKIALGQVAGNSNLKFGVRPRLYFPMHHRLP